MTEEDLIEDTDEDVEAEEEREGNEPAVPPAPGPAQPVESSLDELIAKRQPEERAAEEEDDESMLAVERDERVEPLAVKVVPQQPTEFVCKKCFLVKHRSQLSDRKRTLCRDCA